MKTSDIQQAVPSMTTVLVIGGPLVVRVHKAKDAIYADSDRHGYFLSVDFKFREHEALNLGKPGLLGLSRGEALREGKELAAKIASYYSTMKAAEELVLKWNTATNRITVKVQTERFNKLVSKYTAEFI